MEITFIVYLTRPSLRFRLEWEKKWCHQRNEVEDAYVFLLSVERNTVIGSRSRRIIIRLSCFSPTQVLPANGENFPYVRARHLLEQRLTIPRVSGGVARWRYEVFRPDRVFAHCRRRR